MSNEVIYNKWLLYIAIFFAAIGGMLYGYDIGIINGALLPIQKEFNLSYTQLSFLAGSVLYGGAFATLFSGYLADIFGRKKMIITSAIIFIISIFIIYMATGYTSLFIGRLVQGISVGIITIVIPLYITETVPSHIRGRATVSFQLMLTFGIVFANAASIFFIDTGSAANWRGMFLTALIPGLVMLVGSFLLVRSPRWLSMKGDLKSSLNILLKTREKSQAHKEFQSISESVKHHATSESFYKLFLKKQYLKPILIVFGIAILGQLTGINSFLQMSSIFLTQAGLHSAMGAMIGTTVATGLNFGITIISIIIADKIERKHIVSIGTLGVVIALLFCAVVSFSLPESPLKGYLLLTGILLFIIFYAIGPGAFIWVILSELLPNLVRSKAMAMALFFNSLASAILASAFLPMSNIIGFSGMFLFCAFTTTIYFLIAVFLIPKTTGKSLEEIEASFE
ncbi:MAG: SP family galactose:H+ symporter-like MFS transporter [Francisellaceae bacterium]|jgi:SP family galactose:H+ symporter-like MFS transporter